MAAAHTEPKNISVLRGAPMHPAADADDYEKDFLEKFFRSQAEKKIGELRTKIKTAQDPKKIEEYNRGIARVESELAANLGLIGDAEDTALESTAGKADELLCGTEGTVHTFLGVRIPQYLWDYLFGYQQDGVKWMIDLHLKEKGGILADEMGLGKTLQAVAAVTSLFQCGRAEKALVLCPATLVEQWVKELKRAGGGVKVAGGRLPACGEVAVMSYESFKTANRWEALDIFVLDEGHKIKNRDAQITKLVKGVKCRSRFILTGTPIQNNLSEMWSLFDFVVPGMLGTHTIFQDEFEAPIKQRRCPETSYRYSMILRSIIEPYLLRRLKKQVSHRLPGKVDRVVFVALTELQHRLYIKALESGMLRRAFLEKKQLLAAIDLLRKICNHPFLAEKHARRLGHMGSLSSVPAGGDGEHSEQAARRGMQECQDSDDGAGLYACPTVALSCKMRAMMQLLETWHREHRKVLVFCQTVQMQRIIEQAVRLVPYTYLSMSGSTPIAKRCALVDTFNNTPRVFLFILTTRVGGLGLNLTGANRVVLFDSDWNPASDAQAKERIYRYGQKSDVEIFRIVCRDTIEEKIYQRQIYKSCLSRKILTDPSISIDRNVVIDLFSYQTDRREGCGITIEGMKEDRIEEEDLLVGIKEEDKRDFSIMKELHSKSVLSGPELVAFIERREMNLTNFS